jgi:hypothetical protein
MTLSYNKDILAILEPRFHAEELHGYFGGHFSPDNSRFFAATYVALETIDWRDYSYWLGSRGHSFTGLDFDLLKKPIDDHSYQTKSTDECIEQGIYKGYSLQFVGIWHEGEWYILYDLTFFGEQMPEPTAKAFLNKRYDSPDSWNSGSFRLEWPLKIPGKNMPIRDIEMEEFSGQPWLVSHLKVEHNREVNRTFTAYVNSAIIEPFLKQMRIQFQEEYNEFGPMFTQGCILVFPALKSYFLTVTMARHRVKGFRLVWFFYHFSQAKFYRWTYPPLRFSEANYYVPQDVIMDLQEISDWNDYQFLNSSRTLDDPEFWSEYVLKSENGKYTWLEEIG